MSPQPINKAHSQPPPLETLLSRPSSPATVSRTSLRSLPSHLWSSTNLPTPLPRRWSLAESPTSTEVDPRLQEKPRHTLGPWPLSPNVSSNDSSPSSRSRSCSTFSQLATVTRLLTEEDDTSALVAKREAELDCLFTQHLAEETSPQQIPQTDTPSERAIIRNIFTIHSSLDDEDTHILDEKPEEPNISVDELFPMFPEYESADEEQPLINCNISVHCNVHACDPHKLMLRLKDTKSSHPFAHLQPGDEVQITATAPAQGTYVTRDKDSEDPISVCLMHEGADVVTLLKPPEQSWLQQVITLLYYLVYSGFILAFHEGLLIILSAISEGISSFPRFWSGQEVYSAL